MARRVVLWNLLTLDGYFEGAEKWDLSYHETAWGPELEAFSLEQADEVGALLFGRVTYEGMAAYWKDVDGPIADFMNGVPKVVFSRSLTRVDWANARLVRTRAVAEVQRLKIEEAPGDLFVFGSADLADSLLDAGLVDELRLGLVPMLLGNGTPFFKLRRSPIDLEHLGTRQLGPGCTLLRYRPVSLDPDG
ncbi:dihydrofolate reductase family protein [Gemmatimonadota bacterium Y43]|uniref:dihydrofolate reductase family protein n=1 Tax=Gaopeijia maritima TaxID=3119007 RepID=UPI003276782B